MVQLWLFYWAPGRKSSTKDAGYLKYKITSNYMCMVQIQLVQIQTVSLPAQPSPENPSRLPGAFFSTAFQGYPLLTQASVCTTASCVCISSSPSRHTLYRGSPSFTQIYLVSGASQCLR